MNEEFHNADEDFFPPITQEDYDFTMQVEKEFDVPFDQLLWFIREIRYDIQDDLAEIKDDSEIAYQIMLERLFDSDVKIKEINITTNKGIVKITKSDLFFEYVCNAIQKMQLKLERLLNSESPIFKSMEKDILFHSIISHFAETSLNEFQQRVVIGMFIVHFKLGKPVKTEKEWNEKETESQDYPHYLSDIVKSRLKKFKGISFYRT